MADARKFTDLPLLDVDETLIDSQGNLSNEALIEVLEEAELKDICLFTSMYGAVVMRKPLPS